MATTTTTTTSYEINQRKKLALELFKQQTEKVLTELEKYHRSTLKQVDNVFQKLFGNLPKEIMDMPVEECEQSYLKLMRDIPVLNNIKNEAQNSNDDDGDVNNSFKIPKENQNIVNKSSEIHNMSTNDRNETNLMDFETHLNKDLTSTVKKLVSSKSVFGNQGKNNQQQQQNALPCIDDSIINEESTVNENETSSQPTREIFLNNIAISINYKLKNGTKVTKNLGDLIKTDFNDVDDQEAEYLQKICTVVLN